MRRHNRTHTKVWCWKCPISSIQHGGRPPFWKSLYLHIVQLRRNLERRSTIARIQRSGDENVKFRKSNMADVRHFGNCYIFISQPRIVQIWRNLVGYADANFDPGDRNVRKFQKFSNSRWRTDAIMKIIFGYNSAPYCPIKTNFGMRRHNRTHTKVWWWKCPISNIQHGGRPPFWKSLYPYLSREPSEFDEICYGDAHFDQGNVTKIQKFPNSRWRTDAIL